MIFDTNGVSYDKIAMGEMMAWSVPEPKINQIAKTPNAELFLLEASYFVIDVLLILMKHIFFI